MPKGNPGVPKSKEHNAKNAAAHLGKKRPPFSKEWRHNMSLSHLGKGHPSPKSEEWRKNQSEKMKGNKFLVGYAIKHITNCNNPNCRYVICNSPNRERTQIEIILLDLLSEFPEVIPQRKFGLYHVDAYLPFPYHIAFEADGEYWHRNSKKFDSSRDRYLWEWFGLPVIRLTEKELLEIGKQLTHN